MYKVSVITILKRRHKKIQENLKSLINQTLSDVEIICIYNEENSEINSFVQEKKKQQGDRIKIVHKTRAQDVIAKNKALEEAQGKYLLVTDGNTCYDKTALEKMYNAAESKNTDLAVCGYSIINIDTNQTITSGLEGNFKDVENLDGTNKAWGYLNIDSGNKLVKKEKIGDIKFQNYDDCQDEIFILSAYANVNTVAFVDEELFYGYRTIANAERLPNPIQVKDFQKGLIEVKKIYKDNGRYESLKNIISLIAFSKVGVKQLVEISFDRNVDMKEKIREHMNYLDINFFEWRKNKFLSFSNVPRKAYWVACLIYKFGFQSLYIKMYRNLLEKTDAKLFF